MALHSPHPESAPANNPVSDGALVVAAIIALAAGVNDVWEFVSKVLNPIGFAAAGVLVILGLATARSPADQTAAKWAASALILLASYGVVAANAGWPVLPLLDREANGEARLISPPENASISKCHVTVSYEGKPKSGSAIVAASREKAAPGKDQAQSFYFEAGTRPGGNNTIHDIPISIGKSKIDRDVSFDIFLFAIEESWVNYLQTSRKDIKADNSWWYSVGPPPHSKQLAMHNVVRKKGTDAAC
jgi:hypothetical protein